MSFETDFENAMRKAGCGIIGRVLADGKIHRGGEKPRDTNIWYVLYAEHDFAAGSFGNWRTNETHKWNSGTGENLSKEQNQRINRTRETVAHAQAELHIDAKLKAYEMWGGSPLATYHPYLTKKGIKSCGARIYNKSLIIPVYIENEISSLQFINAEGKKKFLVGGAFKGGRWWLGKLTNRIWLCEGFATAATVHEATNECVLIAFNTGNLKPVYDYLKERYPNHEIIIAADNDHETEKRIGENPGIKAASALGKYVAPIGIQGSDWNDAAAEFGLDWVRDELIKGTQDNNEIILKEKLDVEVNKLSGATDPCQSAAPQDKASLEMNWRGDAQENNLIKNLPSVQKKTEDNNDNLNLSASPVPLGINNGRYFYFSRETKQIEILTASEHTPRGLSHVASETYFWSRTHFVNSKGAVNWNEAAEWLMNAAKERGIFDHSRIRGRGAWIDKGAPVLHLGDRLIIDGESQSLTSHKSKWIYPAAISLADELPEPLSNPDAGKLLDICKDLRWENPIAGYLLAGWIAAAPLCGAFNWRSHIWLTGAASSGKTYVYERIVMAALGKICLGVQGNTTESGIRQSLGCDALPVVFDEAEGNKTYEKEMIDKLMALARSSSSDSRFEILKGSSSQEGAKKFHIRSMWAFCSINVGIEEYADERRITVLTLVPVDKNNMEEVENSLEHFNHLDEKVRETITEDFSLRLLARSTRNLPTIVANAKTFAKAAARVFGNQGAGDQIGTLLAGAFSLTNNKIIDYETAYNWVKSKPWQGIVNPKIEMDQDKILSCLREFTVRITRQGSPPLDRIISELMESAIGHGSGDVPEDDAIRTLQRYGILYQPSGLNCTNEAQRNIFSSGFTESGFWLAHSHKGMDQIFAKTPYSNRRGRTIMLKRITCARSSGEASVRFSGGVKTTATFIPIDIMMGD